MAGSFEWFDDSWPREEGWPYEDEVPSDAQLDPAADLDDDLVSLHTLRGHLLDGLDPIERRVVAARFGLDGQPAQSMKDLQQTLGLSRADLRLALGGGLAKVRTHLA